MLSRIHIILVAIGCLFSPAWCWSGEISDQGPRAYMENSHFEFGAVLEDAEVAHEFILQNRGHGPLRILEIEFD